MGMIGNYWELLGRIGKDWEGLGIIGKDWEGLGRNKFRRLLLTDSSRSEITVKFTIV